MGMSPWESRFSLYHRLRGDITDQVTVTPDMEWGTRHEPAIALKWADTHPEQRVEQTGTWRHRERPWQRSTPDRLLTPASLTDAPDWTIADTEVLELKFSPTGKGWGEDGTDDIPIYYRCQVMWQLDTLGLHTAHVAVLISGYDYRTYTIHHDEAEAFLLRSEARAFLDDVETGRRPDIDGHTATYQTVRQLPDGFEDIDVDIDAELRDRYYAALATHSAAVTELTECRSRVLDQIGTGHRAVTDGKHVATRTVRDGQTYSLLPTRDREHA
jgi:putative phage-type endonuclease